MRIMHYPDYERHKLEHDKLIDQLNVFQAKLADGKISISFELAHFLKAWLTKHIMGTDKYYTPYFLEQGIRPELAKTSWVKKLWGSLRSGS